MRAKSKLYIWLAVLAAISILLYTQWENWFGDLPEPAFSISEKPQRLFIVPGEDGIRDRSFSWVSGKNETFTFILQRDSLRSIYYPTCNEIKTGGGVTYTYGVKLTQLPDGVYQYYIAGAESPDTLRGQFSISNNNDSINFLLIGDIQDKEWCEYPEFFSEIQIRFPSVDAVLFIGDMLERPHNQYWEMFYRNLAPYTTYTPFITVPGNHEYTLGGPGLLDPRYIFAFLMPENGPQKKIGRTFYIDYPLVRIIGIDTNMLVTNYFSTHSWLKSTLETAKDIPFVITMGHHGVYSVRKGRCNPLMKYGIDPVFREYGVDLVLQGHDHAYSRNGGDQNRPIYVTQSTSAKTYEIGDPQSHDKSLTGERLYSHILITKDSLFFDTYRQDHRLFDTFKIAKN